MVNLHPGRRAPAAQPTTGRLPLGTPSNRVTSHSHIQIVRRDDSKLAEYGDYDDSDLPTFRSHSLQFPPTVDDPVGSRPASGQSSKTTFADMARRYNRQEAIEGLEKPASGPMPYAGLIRLLPNRRKTGKLWRPLQLSDFGPDEGNDNDDDDAQHSDREEASPLAGDFAQQQSLEPQTMSSHHRPSRFNLPPIQTNFETSPLPQLVSFPSQLQSPARTSTGWNGMNSEDISPTNTGYGVVDEYTQLFGHTLPDIIRLQESGGDYDGQVTFISHPNRDVTAHQWSNSAFLWTPLGRWSQNRRKIEGPLASDRLRGADMPSNTVHFFKAIAEQREKLYKSEPQSEYGTVHKASIPHDLDSLCGLTPDELDQLASLSSASGSTGKHLTSLGQMFRPRSAHHTVGTPVARTVTTRPLEDPFVTPAKQPQPTIPTAFNFTRGNSNALGSMDFGYEFPLKPATPGPIAQYQTSRKASAHKQLFVQREQERLEAWHCETLPRLRSLRGAGEEDALSESEISIKPTTSSRRVTLSPEDVHNRQQLKNMLSELGDSVRRSSEVVERCIPGLDVQPSQGPARALFPSSGFTVANPNRSAFTFNVNAEPYSGMLSRNQIFEESMSPKAIRPQTAASLKFSDPDIMRQFNRHDVVNNLGHKSPTPQNFHGPFFADQMPTPHDPTTSLSIQIDEEEKLRRWFRDGERPARQQEFSKTIMATADANAKARGVYGAGASDDSRMRDHSRFDYTPVLVSLYENLTEYAEAARSGHRDYFTQAWNTAPMHLCNTSPEGNNSFFENTYPAPPQRVQAPSRGLHPGDNRPEWARRHVDNWRRTGAHGVIADGGFGGPSDRF
jgi:hypothetical protein